MVFDLYLVPLAKRQGKNLSEQPGLFVAEAPRRPARGRAGDKLALFLKLTGNAPLPAEQQTKLLERLSQVYFQTVGSTTAALRSVAESLNDFLLQRNLRTASHGLQAIGLFLQVVFRQDRLFMAVSGSLHAYLLGEGRGEHLYDPQGAGRGLGISRATQIQYYQAELHSNDFLLLAVRPPTHWRVSQLQGVDLESLRRRLLAQAPSELDAVLMQVRPGKGKIKLLLPHGEDEQQPSRRIPRTVESLASSEAVADSPSTRKTKRTLRRVTHPEPSSPSLAGSPGSVSVPRQTTPAKRRRSSRGRKVASLQPLAQAIYSVAGRVGGALRQALSELFIRLLPERPISTLPTSVMAGIAILVPLVLVLIAGGIYLRRGREQQYQIYYQQAQVTALQTVDLQDPTALRAAWETTLFYLDQAEAYRVTMESRTLRSQAQRALDKLDGIERLDFQPAIAGGLGSNARITRMVATQEALFLLDANQGRVLRAWRTGKGYEIDPAFRCNPGQYGQLYVDQIIDLAAMPPGNEMQLDVVAMDGKGNLLYCSSQEPALAASLSPPETNWKKPVALTVDINELYILDPQANAVWIYGSEGDTFGGVPRLYFSEQVPPMEDVIDLAVYQNELYLLHADGHISNCTYSSLAGIPTTCTDPLTYTDPRPGREDAPIILDAVFSRMQFTAPPDPSLYLLEPESRAIYHFSARLNFQRQYRSLNPLPAGLATGFTIGPNRTVFLALGGQVFFASLP